MSFLAGGGEMGARMRACDWSASPLGAPDSWAQPLKTLAAVLLASKQAMFIGWGPQRIMLYNDSYAEILGLKHPAALGQPCDQVWSEIWGDLEPLMTRCYAGEPIQMDDIMLVMGRRGYPEETHFAFSYTPVYDEVGRVAGVFCPCIETTAKVLADRRQAFQLELGERLRNLSDPRQAMATAAEALGRQLDAAQVGYAEVDTEGYATTGGEFHDGRIPRFRAGRYLLENYGRAMAAEMVAGRMVVVNDVQEDARTSSPDTLAAYAAISLRAFVVVPLLKGGRLTAYLYAAHPQPRWWSDEQQALAREVAEQTWSAVERARAEAALRDSEARFRLMADAVPQIVWITDAKGQVEFFNRQWTNYTGVPYEATKAGEVTGSFVHPDDAALTIKRFEKARRKGSTFLIEHRLRSKSGEYRWFLARGEPYHDPRTGKVIHWFGASADIHDLKHAEAALREREERLRLIVENARDYAILTTDADGRIDTWLPGAVNVFGWSAEEAVGHSAAMIFTPEDQETGEYEKELETARREGVGPGVRWHLRKDGSRVFIEGSVTALFAPSGHVRGFLRIGQDVTKRKAAEEAQTLLAREVDHRAKNALAVVQTMLRLTRADDVPSFARVVEGRVSALARAQTILAERHWEGAPLHTLLSGELAPFLAGQRAELDGPPIVLPPGTAQPLAMAMHELATNAVKHGALSVPEGRVSVSWHLDCSAPGLLQLRWAEAGGPPIDEAPAQRGFGARVLEGTVRRQIGGAVSLLWNRTGLVCEMEIPLRPVLTGEGD